MNKRLQVLKYVIADIISATAAWSLFYIFRKLYIETEKFGTPIPVVFDSQFYWGLLFVPLFWLLLYYLTGTYKNIYRKSRLKEAGQTLQISVISVLILFFALLLDDEVDTYKSYYQSILALFLLHFGFTATFRFILSSITNRRIHKRIIGFNTLLIGSNENALKLYTETENQHKSSGNKFVGFVHVDNKNGYSHELNKNLPHLGELSDLKELIKKHDIEEVIIAIESFEHENIGKIVNELDYQGIIIKVIPDMYDILSGSVKMTSIFGAPLIEISREIMPTWEQSVKRIIDIAISLFVLTAFSWVSFYYIQKSPVLSTRNGTFLFPVNLIFVVITTFHKNLLSFQYDHCNGHFFCMRKRDVNVSYFFFFHCLRCFTKYAYYRFA